MLMPVGAISANGQGLLCTGLLLLVCAGLFAAMTAVVYRTTPGRTVCCALPALVSFALLLAMMSGLWDGFDAPEAAWAAPQVGRLPLGAMLAVMALLGVLTGVALWRVLRWMRDHVSPAAVKEGIDRLPAGLCFYVRDGLPRLVNERMEQLCCQLTGQVLLNGETLWQRLTTGDVEPPARALETGDTPLVDPGDGTVWSFTRTLLEVDGEAAWQLVASEVTGEYALNCRLREENARLEAMNRRLRRYGDQVCQLAREREVLHARMRVHDEFGQALLSARQLLVRPGADAPQRQEVLAQWRRALRLLESTGGEERGGPGLEDLIRAAETIGVRVEVTGEQPAPDSPARALLTSAARECLTNTVRHAGGTTLWVRLTRAQGWLEASFTNDGAAPGCEVTEGGGLSVLRRRVERTGGSMQVQSAPRFMLTVTCPEEGVDEL